MATSASVNPLHKPAVAVLGSGSWGTALAVHLGRTGHRTILWGIETEELNAMARPRKVHRERRTPRARAEHGDGRLRPRIVGSGHGRYGVS